MTTHDIDRSLVFLMHFIASRVEAAVNRQVRPLGLRTEEIRVVISLSMHDLQPVGGLAARLGIDRTTLSRILKTMEGKGLVRRTREDSDNRVVRLTLTKKGQDVARSGQPTFRDFDASVARGLKAAEIKELKRLLTRMADNAERV